MTTRVVEIGSFLTLATRDQRVDPLAIYPMMGVRSFGRGPFAAEPLSGDATAYSTLRKVEEGDVVYPKLMAWEGAFAIVPRELAGRWVSPEFCIFEVDDSVADHRFVSHLVAWEGLRDGLMGQSSGTNARRRRLQPNAFLAHRVALPEIEDQRRFAQYLDRHQSRFPEVVQADQRHRFLERAIIDETFSALSSHTQDIGGAITLNRDVVEVSPSVEYRTLGVLNRGRGVFAREIHSGEETKYRHYFRIRSGQLIYSKLFGWEGSVAIVPERFEGYLVSVEFPTFDIDPEIALPTYVEHLIRWSGFIVQLASATTGMGQRRQRVNVSDFAAIKVPIPDLPMQRRIGAHFDKLAHISGLVRRRASVSAALLPAARNQVFSALR